MVANPTTNLVSINDLESVSAWNDLTHADFKADVQINFFSAEVQNKPEFDGKFFVKVNSDQYIKDEVYLRSTNFIESVIFLNIDSYFE